MLQCTLLYFFASSILTLHIFTLHIFTLHIFTLHMSTDKLIIDKICCVKSNDCSSMTKNISRART